MWEFEVITVFVLSAVLAVGGLFLRRRRWVMLAGGGILLCIGFGFIGTVIGLFQAFDAVSHASAEEKQMLLAEGITLAMGSTRAALLSSVILTPLVFGGWLRTRPAAS